MYNKAFQMLFQLRNNGICADLDYRMGSFKSQMRRAGMLGCSYCLIWGYDEDLKGGVALKNMNTGVQEFVPYGEIIDKLKEKAIC